MNLDEPFIFDDDDDEMNYGSMSIRGVEYPVPNDFEEYMDSIITLPILPPPLRPSSQQDIEMDAEFREWLYSPPINALQPPSSSLTPNTQPPPVPAQRTETENVNRADCPGHSNVQNNCTHYPHGTRIPDYHRHALLHATYDRMVMIGNENDENLDWRMMLHNKRMRCSII
jgi:hypothetical protein